MRTINRTVE